MNSECDKCGLCCKQLIIEIDHLDVVREPRLLEHARVHKTWDGQPHESDWDKTYALAPRSVDGKTVMGCGFLGPDNACQIYPTRPNCCVAFEAGDEKCEELREQAGLPSLRREVLPS